MLSDCVKDLNLSFYTQIASIFMFQVCFLQIIKLGFVFIESVNF